MMNDSHLLPRTVLRWLLVAAGALVWAWPVPAQAAGRIDPTFHPPKRLLKLDSLGGVVQGPGGEVTLSRYDGTLARLTGDGSVDTSFGGGIRTLPLPAYTSLAAVLPLAAGDVLVSTSTSYPHVTIRLVALTAQGTVDQSFGENGAFTYDGLESATVIRASDGGFLIAGPLNNDGTHSQTVVLRLTPGGHLDTGFGDQGRVVVTTGLYGSPVGLGVQGDDLFVLTTGYTDPGFVLHTYLGRLSATDGKPRSGFGDDGFRMLRGAYGFPSAMMMWRSRVLVSGGLSSRPAAYVARLLPSGDPDPRFGRNGRFVSDRYNFPRGMLVDRVGRPLVYMATSYGPSPPRLLRLSADGTLDRTFQAPTPPDTLGAAPGEDQVELQRLALAPDGRLTAVGAAFLDERLDFESRAILLRYLTGDASVASSTGRVPVRRGRVRFPLRCRAARLNRCRTHVQLLGPRAQVYSGRRLLLARGGRVVRVFHLSPLARRKLARGHRLRATLQTTTYDRHGYVDILRRRVTLMPHAS